MAPYARRWFHAAVPVTLLLGIVYAVAQQEYRTGLDDPQIQMAEDTAFRLVGGDAAANLVVRGAPPVDIRGSLAPWLAIYDASGTPLEASAVLDNAPPKLPPGVFDTAQWLAHPNGLYYNQSPLPQHRFTWQPEPGVRQAVVLVRAGDNRYVAAGRNMREVDQRIEHLGEMVLVGWLATLAVIFAVQLAYVFVGRFARSSARGG